MLKCRIYKLFYINFFLSILSFKSELNSAKITYELSGGRFGDNLVAYCHAKWLSLKNNIPLLFKPFEYSNQLAMHYLDEHINITQINKKVLLQKDLHLKEESDSIYSVPYFGEDITEHRTNPHWIYFEVDWKDPEFKKELQKLIDPIDINVKKINLSSDYINVAVHIRQGGGYDQPLSNAGNKSIVFADFDFPLKFPPITFYIDQIKKISEIFKHSKIYLYIFTDDKNPELLVSNIKSQLSNYNNLTFDFRRKNNAHNRNVVSDFFAITQFDCLIRSQSNFSLMASKIGNYKVEIFPIDYISGKNKKPIINKIKIIYKDSTENVDTTYTRQVKPITKSIKSKKKLKDRESGYPYISGDSFRDIADHLFDETDKSMDPKNIKHGDIVFLKTDYMKEFFSKVHPKIKEPYILITHNSDMEAPDKYKDFLNDPKIIKWFGMNPTIRNHPKFIPIPIGIANRYVPHGNIDNFNNIINKLNLIKKDILVGMNFNQTNPKERKLTIFSNLTFCKDLRGWPHSLYLEKMASAKFILSPMGNGLDCHRTWEALLTNTIPILTVSNLDPMLENLPVLIINNWEELTEEYLNNKYEEFLKKDFDNSKIYFDYWHNLIESFRGKD